MKLFSVTQDEWKHVNDKFKIKSELTNARVKKYPRKKWTESQQLNYSILDDPTEEIQNKQVKANNDEWKRAMVKELSRRFSKKNCLSILQSVRQVVHNFHFCRVILSTQNFLFKFWCLHSWYIIKVIRFLFINFVFMHQSLIIL